MIAVGELTTQRDRHVKRSARLADERLGSNDECASKGVSRLSFNGKGVEKRLER